MVVASNTHTSSLQINSGGTSCDWGSEVIQLPSLPVNDLTNRVVVEVWNKNVSLMGSSSSSNDVLIGSGVVGMDGAVLGRCVGEGRGVEVVVVLARGSKRQGKLKLVVEAKKPTDDKGEG